MRALIWDMDDTLLNTLPARCDALSHAYRACFGTSTDPLALWRSHRGGTLEEMGARLLGLDGRRFVEAYRDAYYANHERGAPYAGIETVLARLHDAGVPMAVVTSKIAHGATDELERAGLLRYFEAVVAYDDTDAHKPDPAPVFEALDRLLIEPGEDIALVGDSPADIWAARNAGCTSVGALWGTLDAELLRDAMPDALAEVPVAVPDVLFARFEARA